MKHLAANGWLRSVAALLAVFAVLCVFAWLRYRSVQPNYPAGSSLSTQPNGTKGLLLWLDATGMQSRSLTSSPVAGAELSDALFVIEPILPLTPAAQSRLDAVADRGGTLVLAGGSGLPTIQSFLNAMGISSNTGALQTSGSVPGSSITVPMNTHLSLQAPGATPILVAPDGAWLAVREPYRQGTVVALASSSPLTNEGLRDPNAARFVYEQLVARMPNNGTVVFDETYQQLPGTGGASAFDLTTMWAFLVGTAVGGAVLYAGAVVFLYVLLSGRRLGPPLPPARPDEANRTMYEQVQAVAGLYRRAAQFQALRQHFGQYYRRRAGRALALDAFGAGAAGERWDALLQQGLPGDRARELATALGNVEQAGSERSLAAAVRIAEQTVAELPHAWSSPA